MSYDKTKSAAQIGLDLMPHDEKGMTKAIAVAGIVTPLVLTVAILGGGILLLKKLA